jgi:proline dehydrogenase
MPEERDPRQKQAGAMIRRLSAFAVRHAWLRKVAVSMPWIRDLAWRFVAGEDLDAGVAVARELNGRGILATLNLAGNHSRSEKKAVAAADEAISALRRIHEEKLDANVSVKLTQLGLDIDDDLCRAQIRRVLDCAAGLGSFVRIDAEESRYFERTVRLFEELREGYGRDTIGLVVQSYLKRARPVLERLVAAGSRIRLVKGGYWEPASVVHRTAADIEAAFARDIELLLPRGPHPAIATHDRRAIALARRVADEARLDKRAFEFQTMYGVHPDVDEELVRSGYTLRCYVPYGRRGALQRLIERPRNAA